MNLRALNVLAINPDDCEPQSPTSARGSEPTQIVHSCKTSSSPSGDDLGFFIGIGWCLATYAVGTLLWLVFAFFRGA